MPTGPDNAGREQNGQFAPGCSGNPAGMKPGTRHRATRLAEKLMAGDAEAVINAVVAAAKDGDMTAARLVLDRIAPSCRGWRVRLDLPPIVGAADLVKALASPTSWPAASSGRESPSHRRGPGTPSQGRGNARPGTAYRGHRGQAKPNER